MMNFSEFPAPHLLRPGLETVEGVAAIIAAVDL